MGSCNDTSLLGAGVILEMRKTQSVSFLMVVLSALMSNPLVFAEVSQTNQPYADRAHWFQLMVPEGWQAAQSPKGASEVLTLKDETTSGARLTLQIRPLKGLSELVTREQLLEQAKAILKAVTLQKSPGPVSEITGWPMTGVIAEYSESSGTHTRLTILIDVPRKRAFIWKATAPAAIFPRYDATFDRIIAGLVPALPEG